MLDRQQFHAGLSLLFAAGTRPTAQDIEAVLSATEMAGSATRVSHRPPDDPGWVELLSSGLTFDLTGLSPSEPPRAPEPRYRFGIAGDLTAEQLEAVTLAPGPHIAGGRAMMPVIRTMAGLAANLALPLAAKAVCWHPAQSWMEPGYFVRVVLNWLSGGAFPALGLTAIEDTGEGAVASRGLAYFAGQEIELSMRPGETPADAVKLAVRIIDHITRNGPIRAPQPLKGPDGEVLMAEPSRYGDLVLIRRDA